MIASHNSYTYLPAKYKILNLFSFLWRCQSEDLGKQINKGVRYLDIRVRYSKRKKCWLLCHGIVDLYNVKFLTINDLCNYLIYIHLSNKVYYRLLLERGNEKDKARFIEEFEEAKDNRGCLMAGFKKPWTIIHSVNKFNNTKDYCYVPVNTGTDSKGKLKFSFTTIKKWARKHNPFITKAMIEDDNLYFMDYAGINN